MAKCVVVEVFKMFFFFFFNFLVKYVCCPCEISVVTKENFSCTILLFAYYLAAVKILRMPLFAFYINVNILFSWAHMKFKRLMLVKKASN
jgi:hypothetical protein